MSLNWDGIEDIVEEGIKLKTGEVVPLDIIIFGTGYSLVRIRASFGDLTDQTMGVSQEPRGIQMKGSNGKTMQEYFEEQGGATAYLGSSVPGFPNLYTLLG